MQTESGENSEVAFLWLWGGQSVSLAGSRLSALTFQVVAVSTLHANALQMGILTACETIPYLLFGLLVGVLVDCSSRRRLLIGTDAARFVILLITGLLAAAGRLNIPILCMVVCMISSFNLIFDAALGAYVPQILSRSLWMRANSRLSVTQSGSEIVGPAAGGYILQTIPSSTVMLLDGLSYLVSAVCILAGRAPRADPARPRGGVMLSIAEGIRFVVTHRILRIFAFWAAVWNFSWSAVLAVFVLYATRVLMMSPGSIGMVLAVGGVGGVLGGAIASRLSKRWSRGRVLVAAPLIGACGGALLLGANGAYGVLIVAAALLLYNVGETAFGVNMQTCRQELTPTSLMGRMDTTMRLCFRGMASIGALSGGLIGSRYGLRASILAGVSGLFITVVGLYASRLSYHVNESTSYLKEHVYAGSN